MNQKIRALLCSVHTFLLAVERGALTLLLSAMVVIASLQIFLRNFFDVGLSWGDPLLRSMVLWLALFGAMVASRDNKHINIDLLSRFLPVKGHNVSHIISDLVTSIVCAVVTYHSIRFVYFDMESDMVAFAGIPAWYLELIIPFGFCIIAMRYFIAFVNKIMNFSGVSR